MSSKHTRTPLTRERILQAAVGLADREGLGALTMRRLGAELGVEAMSLYKHVANKDEILDGIIDLVIGEIEIPEPGDRWRQAMRRRAISARAVLGRHSWAIGLFETRGLLGHAVLRYLDAILGNLRSAGFSVQQAGYALWLLDSYLYGHAIQETGIPTETADDRTAAARALLGSITSETHPHFVEIQQHALGSAFGFDEAFEFGLELILEALERLVGANGG